MGISLRLAAPPSDAEILELSQRNPGFQFERSAAGELIVTPASSEGGRREATLVIQLGRWADVQSGVVFGPSAGFRLPDGSLLAPDASWMPSERWESLTPEQRDDFARLCPDAVFEVASKRDTMRDLRAKCARTSRMEHGWLCSSIQRTVLSRSTSRIATCRYSNRQRTFRSTLCFRDSC